VLVVAHPFRAPRHTIAEVGLIGGGQVPMPDEVSLVHHGVLVLVHGWRVSATCSGLRESRARLSRGNPHDQCLGATGDTCEPLSDGRPRAEPCVR
jgi:magnesium chelatase subunit ChlI-like protein